MSSVPTDCHHLAVYEAEIGFHLLRRGQDEQAHQHFRTAYKYERMAADALREQFDREPTRSVLYRSAGWLAYHAQQYNDALECAEIGLAGRPRADIRRELEELRACTHATRAAGTLAEAEEEGR